MIVLIPDLCLLYFYEEYKVSTLKLNQGRKSKTENKGEQPYLHEIHHIDYQISSKQISKGKRAIEHTKKVNFEKKSADDNKCMTNYPAC